MQIAIIGAGAAGCFAAIEIKRAMPEAHVTVYERGPKPLAKVAITGGGRCNITNTFLEVKSMEQVYPRGAKLMKRLMRDFSNNDTIAWFENLGIRFVTQSDQCIFPLSQDAMEIVHALTHEMQRLGIKLKTGWKLMRLNGPTNPMHPISLTFSNQEKNITADRVVIATGGSPQLRGLQMYQQLGVEISAPVPSLFSLNIPNKSLTALMGTVVDDVSIAFAGTKLKANGALLVTHWGLSGPAILRLSSYAARYLAENDYQSTLAINWFGQHNEQEIIDNLHQLASQHPQKQLSSVYPHEFNARLWVHLLHQAGMREDQRWAELAEKSYRRLAATLTHDTYSVKGKNRFKEEFVTCGGISLKSLNQKTLESKEIPGLYFAGEVTDVDGVTGGFNLQAAWTMAHTVASAISSSAVS